MVREKEKGKKGKRIVFRKEVRDTSRYRGLGTLYSFIILKVTLIIKIQTFLNLKGAT